MTQTETGEGGLPSTEAQAQGQPVQEQSQQAAQGQTQAPAIAPTQSTALSAEAQELMMAEAGSGLETATAEDFAVPRLAIAQALSPQLKKDKAEHIEGCVEGTIFNPTTSRIWDGASGVVIVPISYRRSYIEWVLREQGGGFVKDHGMNSQILNTCKKDDKLRDINPAGNEIVTTGEFFAFAVDPDNNGAYTPVILSMTKTQLKKARQLNYQIREFRIPRPDGNGVYNPPIYARAFLFTTAPENNKKGDWFGWVIRPFGLTATDLPNGMDILKDARDFQAKVIAGDVKAAPPDDSHMDEVEESDDSPM